jgi:hypothetical protein
VINQWNGYELERIFGIKAPNIKELFTDLQWKAVMDEIHSTEFWNKNWNYPVYITQALNHQGLHLKNIRGNFETLGTYLNVDNRKEYHPTLWQRFVDTNLGEWAKRTWRHVNHQGFLNRDNRYDKIFYTSDDDIFTGQWLALKKEGNGIAKIAEELQRTYKFPDFEDDKNKSMAEVLQKDNSVFIHARRGDMLGCNGYCYKFGYFRRAVKYIRSHVVDPHFVFFCDPGSTTWCKENAHIFGLDFKKDRVLFVDWNKGDQSFRDMQLMSLCKHGIITNSSFGWWGAWLIQNPNKITISPWEEYPEITTVHL